MPRAYVRFAKDVHFSVFQFVSGKGAKRCATWTCGNKVCRLWWCLGVSAVSISTGEGMQANEPSNVGAWPGDDA